MTASFVVSTVPPFELLPSNTEFFETVLGYSGKEIQDQSFMVMMGPKSDPELFRTEIMDTARTGKSSIAQFVLYDRQGTSHSMMVSFKPYNATGILDGCLIQIKQSIAITLQDAFQESSRSKAMISAESPYMIQMVNEQFSARMGYDRSQLLGQSLLRIQHFARADYEMLIHAVQNGGAGCRQICGNLAPGLLPEDASFIPIVDAPNGRIKHVLLLLEQPSSTGLGTTHNPSALASAEGFALPVSLQRGFLRCPTRHVTGPAIFPRRRRDGDGRGGADGANRIQQSVPVIVTPELIRDLHGLPLFQAAATIGVSPTAFKKACRRIGITRWAYRRPGRTPGSRRTAGRRQIASGSFEALSGHCGDPPCCAGTDAAVLVPGSPGATSAAVVGESELLCSEQRWTEPEDLFSGLAAGRNSAQAGIAAPAPPSNALAGLCGAGTELFCGLAASEEGEVRAVWGETEVGGDIWEEAWPAACEEEWLVAEVRSAAWPVSR
jgi:hypothetical protein